MAPFQACVRTPFANARHLGDGPRTSRASATSRRTFRPSRRRRTRSRYLACVQLQFYLDDPAFAFDLPLQLAGTRHQLAVWEAMQAIPAGETRTYGELAKAIGSSARAVGGACGANPIPLVVPCHRVVGARRVARRLHGRARGGLRAVHQALAACP